MADGYLETHYAEYEKRKAKWLKQQKRKTVSRDESDPWNDR